MRVLIIDDSIVIRKILESALRFAVPGPTEALHAANGLEGLAVLERSEADRQPLDLILSDVNMPKMDGLAFLLEKQRRNLAPRVPVLMITADGSDPQIVAAVAAGAQGYISKPFTIREVQARIASLLHAPALAGIGG